MDESPGTPESPGWRKRHPVLSRAILYGIGVALVVVAVALLVNRSEVDRQDEIEALSLELDNLDLVMNGPGGAPAALAVLARDFDQPDLPAPLRHRILLAEAQLRSQLDEWEPALARIDDADRLEAGASSREAARIQRAEILARAGREEDALATLRPDPPPGSPYALHVLRALVLSYLHASAGRAAEGGRVLDEALEALPRPLPADERPPVGIVRQEGPRLVLSATHRLVSVLPGEDAPAAWRRLRALLPDTFEAAAYAALGLSSSGQEAEARGAWARAEALDPQMAAAFAVRHPSVRDLQVSLKSESPDGR